MKITVLGCYAPYAPAHGACNGYLLEEGNTRIMLECGNGSFAKLQQHLDFRRLDALIITHYHPDHFHDYHCIRHAIAGSIKDGTRREPLTVYAPAEGEPWREMKEWPGVYRLLPLESCWEEMIGKIKLSVQKTVHPVTCYAVVCSSDSERKIVYTSDTGWSDGLVAFAGKADVLLCETSLRQVDEALAGKKGHLTARQAGTLAAQAGVGRLVLTHLWPEHDHQELLEEAREVFRGKVVLAREGLCLTL